MRSIRRLCGFAVLGVAMLLASKTLADDSPSHEGIVVSAGAGKLVMTDAENKQHSHDIDETVIITVNGKPGKLEDLKKGFRIRVTSDKDGKVVAVSTVDREK